MIEKWQVYEKCGFDLGWSCGRLGRTFDGRIYR